MKVKLTDVSIVRSRGSVRLSLDRVFERGRDVRINTRQGGRRSPRLLQRLSRLPPPTSLSRSSRSALPHSSCALTRTDNETSLPKSVCLPEVGARLRIGCREEDEPFRQSEDLLGEIRTQMAT